MLTHAQILCPSEGAQSQSSPVIMARLGDLDLKSPSKFGEWRKMEQQLIDEGWYTGQESPAMVDQKQCSLQRILE